MTEEGQPLDSGGPEPPSQDDLRQYVMDVMGWNSYQASAYVAVVRDGPLEPKDIVAMTEIPQGRVYDIMSTLEGDYVSVQGAQPKRYLAQHPRSVLGDKREAFISKVDSAIDHLEQQFEIQRERQDPRHPAWVIPGMAGIKREILSALRDAKKRVELMDQDGRWIQDNQVRDFRRMADDGVNIEIVGRPQWADILHQIAEEVGCPTWSVEEIGSSVIIIDNELAIMRTGRGDTGVKIEDDGTVKTLQRAFQATREDATGVQPDA